MSGTYSLADVTALDTANSSVIGYWTDQETTFAALMDWVAQSVGAWWGADRLGVFRIKQFTIPSGAVALVTVAGQIRKLTRRPPNDTGQGTPTWRTVVRYARNYSPMKADLAGGVSDAERARLSVEWREVTSDDTAVLTPYPMARQAIYETLLTSEANAQTEADRRQAITGVVRDCYDAILTLDAATLVLDLGDVVTLAHSRFSLTAGVDQRIIGVDPNVRAETVALTLWGRASA